MKLGTLFNQKEVVLSIECFPPKEISSYEKMQSVLRNMKTLNPDFISVTYGAGGSSGGVASSDIASFLKNDLSVESVAHVVCMGSEKDDMEKIVQNLKDKKIENVLALRGDESPFRPLSKTFKHASDLVTFFKERGDFLFLVRAIRKVTQKAQPLKRTLKHLFLNKTLVATISLLNCFSIITFSTVS